MIYYSNRNPLAVNFYYQIYCNMRKYLVVAIYENSDSIFDDNILEGL